MRHDRYTAIIDTLRRTIEGTQWEGHVFCVGGQVRDEIMGNEIKDIDLVVDLQGGGIKFAEWMHAQGHTAGKVVTYPTYSTAMFRLKHFRDEEIECVQTRKEKYPDAKSRNPETAFGTIEEDCLRRDLTINSLYRNITTGRLLDITGRGVSDIEQHIIRTTTEPDIIFDDDPLRILRCIRFATRFGWEIEPDTYTGMKRNAARLDIITRERVRDELDKMLVGPRPVQSMELLRSTGALLHIVPELNVSHTEWNQLMRYLTEVSASPLEVKWAAMLHNAATDYRQSALIAEQVVRHLRYSNDFIKEVKFLVNNRSAADALIHNFTAAQVRRLQYRCVNRERFDMLMDLIAALTGKSIADDLRYASAQLIDNGTAMFGYKPPVTGNDVMAVKQIGAGPEVKRYYDQLIEIAYENPVRSRDEWLSCISKMQ